MKKIILLTLLIIFLNISVVYARDIFPIHHNEFGETELAIDLDSIKPYSNGTYSVEVLGLNNIGGWDLKEQIPICKYEIDINNEQSRIIECYGRYRKNWKISDIGRSNAMLEERGDNKWQKVKKDTPGFYIYCVTSLIALKGKKYFKDNFNNY